jgi:hypothetical protein
MLFDPIYLDIHPSNKPNLPLRYARSISIGGFPRILAPVSLQSQLSLLLILLFSKTSQSPTVQIIHPFTVTVFMVILDPSG